MPPRKKTTGAVPPPPKPAAKPEKKIPLNVAVERKLIDSKIIIPEDAKTSTRLLKVVSYGIILGGLAGASLIVYLRLTQFEPDEPESAPRISIPETAMPPASPPPPAAEEEKITPPASVQVVEILDTPTGFLNVRSGPGTSFSKITEVRPKGAFILVSTDAASGWHQIRLADGSTGWITGQYAAVK